MPPHRILVVDDDPVIRETVETGLKRAGFEVYAIADGRTASSIVVERNIDVAVVDIVMPEISGLDLIRELRKFQDVGIVVLSGQDASADRIVGLEVGADDYVTKPFDVREVVARVRSVLRRAAQFEVAEELGADEDCYDFLGWSLIPEAHRLIDPGGGDVELNAAELKLLEFLIMRAPQTVSPGEFVAYAKEKGVGVAKATMVTVIKRLRKKLGDDSKRPLFIRNVREEGYLFVAKVTRATRRI